MNKADWRDSLGALLGSMPEGSPENPVTETSEVSAPKPMKLNVIMERKGHRGKTVTIIEGFTCPEEETAEIASRLKRHLGTGGSQRGGEILVQGDRRDDVIAWLKANSLIK